jgi:3,2-trans-enoyl-CoA isomerase
LIPDPGKNITKLQYRNEFASILGDPDRLRQDSEMGWQMLSEPSTIKALDRVFANLSKPKSKM